MYTLYRDGNTFHLCTTNSMEEKIMAEIYKPHSVPTEISATSRASIKVSTKSGDNFYTVEAYQKRTITETEGLDIDSEYAMLFDDLNKIIDNQCEDIIRSIKK